MEVRRLPCLSRLDCTCFLLFLYSQFWVLERLQQIQEDMGPWFMIVELIDFLAWGSLVACRLLWALEVTWSFVAKKTKAGPRLNY